MNAGRPLQFNPDKALDAAMQLFWRKGYESTSLQNLIDEMKLSKSSFYLAFKSKHHLFQLCLQQYSEMLFNHLSSQMLQADSAMQFIESLFYNVANETCGKDARRGCLLMNTASEFAQTDSEISKLVNKNLENLTKIFEQAVIEAIKENKNLSDKDSHKLALYLVSSMSGLKTMVKSGADKPTIKSIVGTILLPLR